MSITQIALPFRRELKHRQVDYRRLVGRWYAEDQTVSVVVIGVCQSDPRRVVLRRRPGGMVSLPGWLVQTILQTENKTKRLVA